MDTVALRLREEVYGALVVPFTFPSSAASEEFRAGTWQDRLISSSAALWEGSSGVDLPRLELDDDAFQSEFIALFEVGVGGAPCPLHSGHYGRDRMINMEEIVRFYDFFGFKPGRSGDHYPDHITAELSFMAYLAQCQQRELARGGDHESPVRAQRDFLTRHLAAWLPQLEELVIAREGNRFFRQIIRFMNAFTARDCRRLDALADATNQTEGASQHG